MTMNLKTTELLMVLVLCRNTVSYEFVCPMKPQRDLRANGYCTYTFASTYACLYDRNLQVMVESCKVKPDHSSTGERYVIIGRRTSEECPPDRYQPFALWANVSGNCLFFKSTCNEEGQLISTNSFTKSDSKCRCDFEKGYDYVIRPADPCACISSQEDCTCYLNHSTIQGYRCPPSVNVLPTFPSASLKAANKLNNTFNDTSLGLIDVDCQTDAPKTVVLVCAALFAAILSVLLLIRRRPGKQLEDSTGTNTNVLDTGDNNGMPFNMETDNCAPQAFLVTDLNQDQMAVEEKDGVKESFISSNKMGKEITPDNKELLHITEDEIGYKVDFTSKLDSNNQPNDFLEVNLPNILSPNSDINGNGISLGKGMNKDLNKVASNDGINSKNKNEIRHETVSPNESPKITSPTTNTNTKPVSPNCGIKLVAAIDIGTTSSVYAFCAKSSKLQRSPDVVTNDPWNSGDRGLCSTKTPTCILLNKDYEVLSIGYEAQNEYRDHIYDEDSDDYYFVHKFKMELYNQPVSDNMTIKDIKGRAVPASQVFSMIIYKLKQRLENENNHIPPDAIQWVLTVPAIWTDKAKQFMHSCAIKAGMNSNRLLILVESEAASVYMYELLRNRTCNPSLNKFLVIDIGGGTNDITAHGVEGGRLKELCEPGGSDNGGKKVDKLLLKRLESIVGPNVINGLAQDGSYLELLEEVENVNNRTSTSSVKKIPCKVPLSVLNSICFKYGGVQFSVILQNSPSSRGISLMNDRLRIDRNLMNEIILEVASGIITDVKNMLRNFKPGEINTFIVVGGFSNSLIIRDKLKQEFESVSIIFPPNDVDLAVVKGAVLYGENPNYIKPNIH